MKFNIIIFLTLFTAVSGCAAPKASIIVKVVDSDSGVAVSNAKVKVWYEDIKAKGFGMGWGNETIRNHKIGFTNDKGVYPSSAETNKSPRIYVDADDYYQSRASYEKLSYNKLLNRWEPYPCEVTVELKKVKNPVPMYFKYTDWINSPKNGKSIGFDLEVGDWVSPHGKGKLSDFIIKENNNFASAKDVYYSDAEITFSNEGDGIVEFFANKENQSMFKYPYQAPLAGYAQKLKKIKNFNNGIRDNNIKQSCDYLFRVRTKMDSNGNVISANYGYLNSDFDLNYRGGIKFSYYFNSDNKSRSLEYSGENLFKNSSKKR